MTCHNKEKPAICLKFVEKIKNISEAFVGFLPLDRITGVYITETTMDHLKRLGPELNNICGQGYNGVSNVSSVSVGVQGIIKKESPLLVYVKCSGRCLTMFVP